MANLIRTDAVVGDEWQRLDAPVDPVDLPAGALIVPLATWLAHREALTTRGEPVGVWLATDDLAESLDGHLDGLSLIAIHFPVFSDGRGYSTARILRERLGWRGELRAIGDVLRDQVFAMRRCGFDSFEIRADRDPNEALASFGSFRNVYQHATVDPGIPLIERR